MGADYPSTLRCPNCGFKLKQNDNMYGCLRAHKDSFFVFKLGHVNPYEQDK